MVRFPAHIHDAGSSPRVRGTQRDRAAQRVLPRFIPACAGNAPARAGTRRRPMVHPRVCGERCWRPRPTARRSGSSPRVRGTRHRPAARADLARFIPACAGNATAGARCAARKPVHPRVCGERLSTRPQPPSRDGSSPRVRGTQPVQRRAAGRVRFIPACAGNAPRDRASSASPTVHPRVCGERAAGARRGGGARRFIPACAGNAAAPPPATDHRPVHPRVCGERAEVIRLARVKGRFIPACAGNATPDSWTAKSRAVHPRVCGERGGLQFAQLLLVRFIPACAGNAAPPSPPNCGRPVHPRVCGERRIGLPITLDIVGSSPRVRGTPPSPAARRAIGRFIPACAGNAGPRPPAPAWRPVHPRVCGERERQAKTNKRLGGSSPRVRGTQSLGTNSMASHRFIPACAGNAPASSPADRGGAVHPRVCGERDDAVRAVRVRGGSSPRVRGTRPLSLSRGGLPRFIPACAGNAQLARTRLPMSSVHPRVCGERWLADCGTCAWDGSSPRVRGTL